MTLTDATMRRKRKPMSKPASKPAAPERSAQSPQSSALLAWYDRHRRRLPWRAAAGERSDPYRVWLSEIMLQQTTVAAVAPYYTRFLKRWPDVKKLAAASLDEVCAAWAGLGYYSRARFRVWGAIRPRPSQRSHSASPLLRSMPMPSASWRDCLQSRIRFPRRRARLRSSRRRSF